jgi:transposase InsO family protein
MGQFPVGEKMDSIISHAIRKGIINQFLLKEYRRVTDLIAALKAYFGFYNHERPHQGLAGTTPVQVHRGEVRLAA